MDDFIKSLVSDGVKEALSEMKWDIADATTETTINRLQEHKEQRDELNQREKRIAEKESKYERKKRKLREESFEFENNEKKLRKKMEYIETLMEKKDKISMHIRNAKLQAKWLKTHYPKIFKEYEEFEEELTQPPEDDDEEAEITSPGPSKQMLPSFSTDMDIDEDCEERQDHNSVCVIEDEDDDFLIFNEPI
jgi:DNA repair exonuclease SbcCD ATPase subunit